MKNWDYTDKEGYCPGVTLYHGWICYDLPFFIENRCEIQGVRFQDVFHYDVNDSFWIPHLDLTIKRATIEDIKH